MVVDESGRAVELQLATQSFGDLVKDNVMPGSGKVTSVLGEVATDFFTALSESVMPAMRRLRATLETLIPEVEKITEVAQTSMSGLVRLGKLIAMAIATDYLATGERVYEDLIRFLERYPRLRLLTVGLIVGRHHFDRELDRRIQFRTRVWLALPYAALPSRANSPWRLVSRSTRSLRDPSFAFTPLERPQGAALI